MGRTGKRGLVSAVPVKRPNCVTRTASDTPLQNQLDGCDATPLDQGSATRIRSAPPPGRRREGGAAARSQEGRSRSRVPTLAPDAGDVMEPAHPGEFGKYGKLPERLEQGRRAAEDATHAPKQLRPPSELAQTCARLMSKTGSMPFLGAWADGGTCNTYAPPPGLAKTCAKMMPNTSSVLICRSGVPAQTSEIRPILAQRPNLANHV